MERTEQAYRNTIAEVVGQLDRVGPVELVIGVPFLNETDTLAHVVTTVSRGLREFWPDHRAVILCAGSPRGKQGLETVNRLGPDPTPRKAFLLPDRRLDGKGWAVRAILEIAASLGASLALLLEADLLTVSRDGETEGLTTEWVRDLLAPVLEGHAQVVLGRFCSDSPGSHVGDHLAHPLLAALHNVRLHGGLEGEMALSRDVLPQLLEEPAWHGEAGGYGIDTWLVARAVTTGAEVAEVDLGVKRHQASAGKLALVFRQAAGVLFHALSQTEDRWLSKPVALRTALRFGPRRVPPGHAPFSPPVSPAHLRRAFDRFGERVWARILPPELLAPLADMCAPAAARPELSARLWARIVYHFLAAFRFESSLPREDVLAALVPLFQARLATFARELTAAGDPGNLAGFAREALLEAEVEEFLRAKPEFLERWKQKGEAVQPYLPEVSSWEFIPGVPLLVPQQIGLPGGNRVAVAPIYERLVKKYRSEFAELAARLGGLPEEVPSRLRALLLRVEEALDHTLLPGDLTTVEGTGQVVDAIAAWMPRHPTLSLKPEVAARLLRDHPPRNLLTRWGYADPVLLCATHDPLDILALAGWSEDPEYTRSCLDWLREAARPEHFTASLVRPLVVDHVQFPGCEEMRETSPLARLAGRVVVGNLRKGTGGEFPKLRYLTVVAKNLVEAERFGRAWERFARDPREFGKKVVSSLEGHWGRHLFSGHNFFENGHHRELVARLRAVAHRLAESPDLSHRELGDLLLLVADSYHLAFTLPGGQFIPCSAWTWASYSFKGGKGIPTPLSLHVERDWFTSELLREIYRAAGGSDTALENKVFELMGQGRESEDLVQVLFGTHGLREETTPPREAPDQPPAGPLRRWPQNPLLGPVFAHDWESRYVLNCAAVRAGGAVHLLYRAVGRDGISRIGLAVSRDGFRIDERLPEPVFSPEHPAEIAGCEDPRVTIIGDRLYMLYTAYDGVVPQVALASISLADFLDRRFDQWHRHGLVFPGFPNKDAVLFPDTFGGRYAMYHRISPSIWLSYSDSLSCPWPRRGHRMVLTPRSGMMWDANKIGAGAPPLRTQYGWLLVYHGVDYDYHYSLGVFLTAPDDPGRVIYRSPNPVLEPSEAYERGEPGRSWVPNVVFTCGAVPAQDKEVLGADDTIIVYYGAADTVICAATATVGDLIPAALRQSP